MEASTRRKRAAVLGTVAGTLVVAAVIAVTQLAGDADPPHTHGTAGSPVTAPHGYLSLRVARGPADVVLSGGVDDGSEQVAIKTPHGTVSLLTQDAVAGAEWRVDPAASIVTVAGQQGFYGDGFAAVYLDFDEGTGTPSPGATSADPPSDTNPRQRGLRTISWQYAHGHWATLRTDDHAVTEQELLRVANGVDFTKRTPMRLALAISRTPPQLVLTGWQTTYLPDRDDPSLSRISFRTPGHYENVTVELDRGSIPAHARRLPFTVHGHRAFTAPGFGAVVFVEEASGYYLQVSAIYPSDGSSYTAATLRPIADLVTVASRPADPTSWFDARTALP